jgi:hypothetical protein
MAMMEETYLEGLLIPKDWHSNGRVKSLALATDDEQEIAIGKPLHRGMIKHMRQRVEIWGVFEDPVLRTVFNVRRLKSRKSSHG